MRVYRPQVRLLLALLQFYLLIVTVEGTICQKCSEIQFEVENENLTELFEEAILEQLSCDGVQTQKTCQGSCMLGFVHYVIEIADVPEIGSIRANFTDKKCAGPDAPRGNVCLQLGDVPGAESIPSLLEVEGVDITELDAVMCACDTDNCNDHIEDAMTWTFMEYPWDYGSGDEYWGDEGEWGGEDGEPGSCFECDYFSATTDDTVVLGPFADLIKDTIHSSEHCRDPPIGHKTACYAGEKCMHADATFTMISDLDGGETGEAEAHWMFRKCSKPKKYDQNVCYVDVSQKGEIYEEMSGFFDTHDIKVKDFDATACYCENANYCNGGSISLMTSELGKKNGGGVARLSLWALLFLGTVMLLSSIP